VKQLEGVVDSDPVKVDTWLLVETSRITPHFT
jgi:hypothetical protein